MNSVERNDKTDQMSALALDELRKFVAKRNTPGLPKNAAITDYELRAYDLEYRTPQPSSLAGSFQLPGTKALRGGEFDYFVTVVARDRR